MFITVGEAQSTEARGANGECAAAAAASIFTIEMCSPESISSACHLGGSNVYHSYAIHVAASLALAAFPAAAAGVGSANLPGAASV